MMFWICIAALIVWIIYKFVKAFWEKRSEQIAAAAENPDRFKNVEIMKVLFGLNEESLNQLFDLYKKNYGAGAARYARKTYKNWKLGKTKPIEQTYLRFVVYLPEVMSYDLKCEVLRRLMIEYAPKNDYEITVNTDDWDESLAPLVNEIIEKTYHSDLPKELREKINWLADGEMQAAQKILRQSQVEESRHSIAMLRSEMQSIAQLLDESNLRARVSHKLKFPYGTITLNIKRS